MLIKVLGTGCKKCKKLEENAKKAVEQAGVEATIEKVEDIRKIMEYGVMSTPALVIDEDVKVMGYVASADEIMKHL